MISLRDACKSYRAGHERRLILDHVTLDLPSGRSIGIFGANGAGKSTLVRLIAGVEPLDRGRLLRTHRVSFPLGFGGTFHPHLTGRENIRFLARIYGANEAETLDYVERFAELGSYFRAPLETYSSGMQARLAFGACLAIRFDLYLIDEVTAVGDARFRRKCLEAFEARAAQSDVIIVSHDESTLRAWCDMGAVLHGGQLELYEHLDDAFARHRALLLGAAPLAPTP
jgi:capsular polysaccharide transport system ATP-binding protein